MNARGTSAYVPRPGFNCCFGYETLAGRSLEARRSYIVGQVRLSKLHGSVSWILERSVLYRCIALVAGV